MRNNKQMDKDLALALLAGAKRRLKAIDLCKKLAKSTSPLTKQYQGLIRKMKVLNIEAQELIAVSRMLWEGAK